MLKNKKISPLLVDKTAKIQDFIKIYTPSKKLFLDELDYHELGEDICQIEWGIPSHGVKPVSRKDRVSGKNI